ncbi:predicted translation initiation factor related to eIF-3a [Moesziomyces antarcticus T-34]|uniref:Eukaryotic translation initiation factor 2A n=1 Tax=Pseudozyma antarctica (strain T-34) TaxID=1151754 RepID=M9LW51_PSEA3|nr:predicted translation initiation factor related to eIF-3a [Moesziomyces antarcticus T-34]
MSEPSAVPVPAGEATTQWAYRAQKSIGLNTGSPSYSSVNGFDQVQGATRVFQYSPDGSTFAAAMDDFTRLVDTRNASTSSVKRDLPVPKVVDLQFSPKGGFLSTWERPSKLEDGSNARNLKIWDTESGEAVATFERKLQNDCFFQFSANEEYCVRQVSTELQIYEARHIADKGVVGRLRLEGITSFDLGPGDKPSIAVFCGEKKGAPASVRVYPLASLIPSPETPPAPVSQKTFFKADKIQIKWNKAGSALLFMTSTDHDKTGKSYYGETNLYLMSVRGDFDCRVGLDKEGPIHDFEWNPNSKEFIVIYGYMPAKAVLFSHRVNVIAELGTQPRNFVAFNPHGRLFCLAGFGNLSGTVDIWDRDNLSKGKIYSMDASNSSVCQWSPDGHFLLTATLSPRLRVENGVKIWHCTGDLIHVDMIDELYQAGWRPGSNAGLKPFPAQFPAAPSPSPAAAAYLATKAATKRPTGAYRPPGARGQNTPDIFKRIDEGGSGASTPENGTYQAPGTGNRKRAIPGAAGAPRNANAKDKDKKKGTKQQQAKNGAAAAAAAAVEVVPEPAVSGAAEVGGNTGAANLEKRVRNLNKKLKAIEELKLRQAGGEKLEAMQLAKIAAEDEVRKELATLE